MLRTRHDQSILEKLREKMSKAIQGPTKKPPRQYAVGDMVVVLYHGGDNRFAGKTAEVIGYNGSLVYQLQICNKAGKTIAEFPCGAGDMKPARNILGLPKSVKPKE